MKDKGLKIFLYVFWVGNVIVHPVIPFLFPPQFFWTPRNRPHEFMIGGIYIAMGIMMILAAQEPRKHKLFVDFIILGNFLHAVVMIIFGIIDQPAHLVGDVLWISVLWILPLVFYPWGLQKLMRPS